MALSAQAFEMPPSNSPYLNTVNAPHQVRLLDNDTAALENVLRMISRARKSIELEYFVFNPDRSGRLVLQALVEKADEGVKIRVLVDYNANGVKPGLDSFYHDELARHGIELRYFNVVDVLEFWEVGFRNHRKLLVVDDEELLMGGRNRVYTPYKGSPRERLATPRIPKAIAARVRNRAATPDHADEACACTLTTACTA